MAKRRSSRGFRARRAAATFSDSTVLEVQKAKLGYFSQDEGGVVMTQEYPEDNEQYSSPREMIKAHWKNIANNDVEIISSPDFQSWISRAIARNNWLQQRLLKL